MERKTAMAFEKLIPVFAPAPVAVVIGMQFFVEVERVVPAGGGWWILSALAAGLGVIGTIGAEMYAYKNALKAFAENEPKAALLSVIGGIVASALVIWTVWRTDDSRPLIVAVIAALISYLVSAGDDYLKRKRQMREQAKAATDTAQDRQVEQSRIALDMEKQRTAQERARARAANSANTVRPARANTPNTPNAPSTRLDPARLALARAAYAADKNISVRNMARAIGAVGADGNPTASTGLKYLDAVKSE